MKYIIDIRQLSRHTINSMKRRQSKMVKSQSTKIDKLVKDYRKGKLKPETRFEQIVKGKDEAIPHK